MIDIHLLKVFVSIYKNRNFTKAGEELYLSQPTISTHIKVLENFLGCRLFDRMGKKVVPTIHASILYDKALEILDLTSNLKNLVLNKGETQNNTVELGASSIPAAYILPKFFSRFSQLYGNIFLKVIAMDSRQVIDSVSNFELLFGLTGSKTADNSLEFIPFAKDEIILVAHPKMIKKHIINIRELKKMPIILRERGSGTLVEVLKNLERLGLTMEDLNIVAEFGSNEAVKEAVINGLGVSFLSSLSVSNEIKNKGIKKIYISDLKIERSFYIVKHKKRTLPLHYKNFIDLLVNFSFF